MPKNLTYQQNIFALYNYKQNKFNTINTSNARYKNEIFPNLESNFSISYYIQLPKSNYNYMQVKIQNINTIYVHLGA